MVIACKFALILQCHLVGRYIPVSSVLFVSHYPRVAAGGRSGGSAGCLPGLTRAGRPSVRLAGWLGWTVAWPPHGRLEPPFEESAAVGRRRAAISGLCVAAPRSARRGRCCGPPACRGPALAGRRRAARPAKVEPSAPRQMRQLQARRFEWDTVTAHSGLTAAQLLGWNRCSMATRWPIEL